MDSLSQYRFADKAFYAVSGEKEKVVARVVDGKVVFEKGCAGPHKAALTSWIREQGLIFEKPVAEVDPTPVEVEKQDVRDPDVLSEDEALRIDLIPKSELPEFDLMLGTATPGLDLWMKTHNIFGAARVALIRKLEKEARK